MVPYFEMIFSRLVESSGFSCGIDTTPISIENLSLISFLAKLPPITPPTPTTKKSDPSIISLIVKCHR